jgi:hypothetical protein
MNDPSLHVSRTIYIEIYNNCRIGVSPLYGYGELRFSMSGPRHDDVNIVFERPVLKRFVKLVHEALKLQLPEDTAIDPPKLVSLGTD